MNVLGWYIVFMGYVFFAVVMTFLVVALGILIYKALKDVFLSLTPWD